MTSPFGPQLSDLLSEPGAIDRLAQTIPGLVYVFDLLERRNIFASRSLTDLLGYSASEVLAMGDKVMATIIHPDELSRVVTHHGSMKDLADGVTVEIEYRVRAANAEWRWLHSWESVLRRSDGGTPWQMVGLAQDVTALRRGEEDLRQSQRALADSEQRWRSIVENPFDFVVVIDRSYKYTFINFVAPGLKAEELIGKATPLEFISPEDHPRIRAAFETVFTQGRPTTYEVYIPQLDQWFSSLVGPIRSGTEITHLSILTRDITQEHRGRTAALDAERQLRTLEAKLHQSAKLEAVGQLAGGIAHDFNNLLMGIGGVAELLAERFGPTDPATRDLQDLQDAVARGAGLTRQLLTFSRQQTVAPAVLELGLVVSDATRLLRRLLGGSIDLQFVAPTQPLLVQCDRTQLEQVLMNLAVNARDAMPKGGRLTIELSTVTVDEAVNREHPEVRPGQFARLVVADQGHGMDAATLARIFEPFFTTKPMGAGTGLGLSVVYGIVRKSGGFIELTSEPGRGTTFAVHLPIATGEAVPAPSRMSSRPRGTETILLVEDEDVVLRFVQRLLEALGYRVLTAPRGDTALAMIEAGARFDLLLSDVLLPGIDGHQLGARLAQLRPGLPMVLMSGYSDKVLDVNSPAQGEASFLQKPFTHEVLATTVREALDRRPVDRPER